jgi:hypothetical protein
MTSPFGAAFDNLPRDTQLQYTHALKLRRHLYLQALERKYCQTTKVVIIGDTPGPGRPSASGYHHTPFYSTKNSSFWLNRQLIEADIPESCLLWFNAVLADGTDLPGIHIEDLQHLNPAFIVLGGNAEKWMRRVAPTSEYIKVYHPQFAKRFKSKEPYELIDILRKLCLTP